MDYLCCLYFDLKKIIKKRRIYGLGHKKQGFQYFRKLRLLCMQITRTANEGPVGIQYKCLVPIYVFPEVKLLYPK
jgi:hypothetical protein